MKSKLLAIAVIVLSALAPSPSACRVVAQHLPAQLRSTRFLSRHDGFAGSCRRSGEGAALRYL
jgi:hypothetical protein